MQNKINFNYNWNNKLQCKIFTTIRLENPKKYIINEKYEIFLKEKSLGIAQIVDIKNMFLKDINEYIAGIDTGYNAEECKNIILKMYPNYDFEKGKISFILLKYVEQVEQN